MDPTSNGHRTDDPFPIPPAIMMIRVGHLLIDPNGQRGQVETRIAAICADWNPRAFGALYVSHREGHFFVIDGQQRLAAVKRMWGDETDVPCLVVDSSSIAQEAADFVDFNGGRSAVNALDTFRISLEGNDRENWAIYSVVTDLGLEISFKTGRLDTGIVGVGALQFIHRRGKPGDLRTVLSILKEAYGTDYKAYAADFMRGIYAFHNRYRHVYKLNRLRMVLEVQGHSTIRARAKIYRQALAGSPYTAIARGIQMFYNHGQRPDARLPEWDAIAKDDNDEV